MALKAQTLERLNWLKRQLKKHPHHYNQQDWCGTQACLAGYCLPRVAQLRKVTLTYEELFKLRDDGKLPKYDSASNVGREWLGLDYAQADLLFAAVWNGRASEFNREPVDTDEQAADKAIQRIDLFIASDGTA